MLFVEFGYSIHFDVDGQNDYYRLKLALTEQGIALKELCGPPLLVNFIVLYGLK